MSPSYRQFTRNPLFPSTIADHPEISKCLLPKPVLRAKLLQTLYVFHLRVVSGRRDDSLISRP